MQTNLAIGYLVDHPRVLAQLAEWLYAEWGSFNPGQTLTDRVAILEGMCQRDELPLALVALTDGAFAGSASLVPCDMETHPELTPWLASVYVHPDYRRRGIASALSERVAAEARRLGWEEIYLFTPDQQGLYARLGWKTIFRERFRDLVDVSVMRRELG